VSADAPSRPGPAQVGVTTHEALRLLGLTFCTDAGIDRVEAGRLLTWHAQDRQKQLRGSRLVEPTGQGSCRFTEVVEVRLLGLLRPLEPLGGAAAPTAGHRRPPTPQTPAGDAAGHQRTPAPEETAN
jgi:hypothetical protein